MFPPSPFPNLANHDLTYPINLGWIFLTNTHRYKICAIGHRHIQNTTDSLVAFRIHYVNFKQMLKNLKGLENSCKNCIRFENIPIVRLHLFRLSKRKLSIISLNTYTRKLLVLGKNKGYWLHSLVKKMMQSYEKAISSFKSPLWRAVLSITSNPSFQGRSCLQIHSGLTRRHFMAPLLKGSDNKLMISPFFKKNLAWLILEELKDISFTVLYFFTDCTKHNFCCYTC